MKYLHNWVAICSIVHIHICWSLLNPSLSYSCVCRISVHFSVYCNTKYGNSIAYLQLFFLLFLFKFLSTSILVKDVTDDPKICPLKKPLVETSRMSSMTAWYFLNKSSNEYMLTKFSLHLSKGRSESWNVQMFQCDVLADELWLFKIFHMLLPQPFTSLPC